MESPTNSPSLRPMQRKRGRAPTKSRKSARPIKQASRVEKRVSEVTTKTAKRPLPLGISRIGNIRNNLRQPKPHALQQEQVDHLSLADKNPPELRIPPPLFPLTTKNLEKHTQLTNPGEKPLPVMTDSETSKSVSKSEVERLQNYGVTNLDGRDFPPQMMGFLEDVIARPRPEETPSADKIWKAWRRARDVMSETDMTNMLAPLLMFNPKDERGRGEESVSLCSDILFNKKYVQHPTREDLGLQQPKPDRVNGYVSNWRDGLGLLKPAFTMAEERTMRDMVELLHPEALFAWYSGEFKSATGQTLKWAYYQNCRAGVAAVNHNREFFATAGVHVEDHDTAHFTIACDAEMVVLYAHWYSDGTHYTRRVYKADLGEDGLWGGKSEQMVKMRKMLRNVLEWAMGPRLSLIRHAISVYDQHRADAAQGKGKGNGKATASKSSGPKSGKSSSTPSTTNPGGRGRGQPPQQQQDAALPRRSNRLQSAGK